MKVKTKTPTHVVIGFTRRELTVISNCLNEACYGLLLDRFLPARSDLLDMLESSRAISEDRQVFRFGAAAA
jgi:hypothetical protein